MVNNFIKLFTKIINEVSTSKVFTILMRFNVVTRMSEMASFYGLPNVYRKLNSEEVYFFIKEVYILVVGFIRKNVQNVEIRSHFENNSNIDFLDSVLLTVEPNQHKNHTFM